MNKVKVKRLHEDAVLPIRAHSDDAGADLVAVSRDFKNGNHIYGTGLAFQIPEEYALLIFPRSSVRKYDLSLANCVGVIDSGYRGEVMVTFRPTKEGNREIYNVGDRVAQAVLVPVSLCEFEEADELTETTRGEGGHGSSGK